MLVNSFTNTLVNNGRQTYYRIIEQTFDSISTVGSISAHMIFLEVGGSDPSPPLCVCAAGKIGHVFPSVYT